MRTVQKGYIPRSLQPDTDEPQNAQTTEWEAAVERVEVRAIPQLAMLISAWLSNRLPVSDCERVVHFRQY